MAEHEPVSDTPNDPVSVSDRPLTAPLLVRGSYNSGAFIACFVAAVVFLCFGLSNDSHRSASGVGPAFFYFTLSAMLGLATLVIGLDLRAERLWLEVTLSGFILSGRGGRRIFADDQVVGIQQWSTALQEGGLKRRIVLEIETVRGRVPERYDCRTTTAAHQEDPVAGFVARLVDAIAMRTEEALSRGGAMTGFGWHLDASGLRHGGQVISLDQITFAGFFDGNLCIWRQGDELPILQIPEHTRNVDPLCLLLTQRVGLRPDRGQAPPLLPLGRRLLERWAWGWIPGMLLLILFGGATVSVLVYKDVLFPWHAVRTAWVFAVATFAIAIVGLIVTSYGLSGRLRFYERGILQRTFVGEKWLPYDDIAEVSWRWGQLTFVPRPGLNRSTIRFWIVSGQLDSHFSALRDHACEHLARQWLEGVPHGPVIWTNRLRFLPDSLECRPAGWLGLDDPISVPYAQSRFVIKGEEFWLFGGEEKQPICKHPTSDVNFFVGVVVLRLIYEKIKHEQLSDELCAAPRLVQVKPTDGFTSRVNSPRPMLEGGEQE